MWNEAGKLLLRHCRALVWHGEDGRGSARHRILLLVATGGGRGATKGGGRGMQGLRRGPATLARPEADDDKAGRETRPASTARLTMQLKERGANRRAGTGISKLHLLGPLYTMDHEAVPERC